MPDMRPLRRLTLALSFVLAACAAVGQDAEDKPFLSGPEVEDTRPGLVEDSFGSTAMGKERLGAMAAIPSQDLRKIIGSMRGDEADSAIRLSQEQYLIVRDLTREFETERRAWMREHREELSGLYSAAGMPMPTERSDRLRSGGLDEQARRRPAPEGEERNMMEPVSPEGARRAPGAQRQARGEGPEASQERTPPTPEQEAARQKLREFMQKGPNTGDLQRQIYAELTGEQQAYIDSEVLRLAEERADAREQRKIDERLKDRREKQGEAGAEDRRARALNAIDWDAVLPSDGTVRLDALPERFRQRLENVEPAQQRQLLERLRDRQKG
ncbi:MAG: hypothetical protein ED559_00550 [Phycisphaera sp.]|nr:MAG: hypothetical protein ED559_00550 [Phycisphaera sp.]